MKLVFVMTMGALVMMGCNADQSSQHVYTPKEGDRKAYDFVHSHKCVEHWHPSGMRWDSDLKEAEHAGAWGAYYCDGIDGIIFVHEESK